MDAFISWATENKTLLTYAGIGLLGAYFALPLLWRLVKVGFQAARRIARTFNAPPWVVLVEFTSPGDGSDTLVLSAWGLNGAAVARFSQWLENHGGICERSSLVPKTAFSDDQQVLLTRAVYVVGYAVACAVRNSAHGIARTPCPVALTLVGPADKLVSALRSGVSPDSLEAPVVASTPAPSKAASSSMTEQMLSALLAPSPARPSKALADAVTDEELRNGDKDYLARRLDRPSAFERVKPAPKPTVPQIGVFGTPKTHEARYSVGPLNANLSEDSWTELDKTIKTAFETVQAEFAKMSENLLRETWLTRTRVDWVVEEAKRILTAVENVAKKNATTPVPVDDANNAALAKATNRSVEEVSRRVAEADARSNGDAADNRPWHQRKR